MPGRKEDPLELKYDADAVLERAADRMRSLLREAVARLDPFPPFPGAFFSYGIEIEVPAFEGPDRGCIVLGEDGEFHEFKMGNDIPAFDLEFNDPVQLRNEELKPLEMHPQEYLVYAYNAISRIAEILLERSEKPEARD